MEKAEFGIDLSGEDEFALPPGVEKGSLSGDEGEESSIPPPKPGEYLIDPEAEKEDEEEATSEDATPVTTSDLSPNHPASGNLTEEEFDESGYDGPMVEEPKPKPKAKPKAKKRAPRKDTPAPAPTPVPVQRVSTSSNDKKTSGTIDRPYCIFQIKPADVDGQIIDVPVPVIFNDDQGGTMDTLVARNRDLALTKAARAFGPGWNGTLIAVPVGMWEPKPVYNRPRNQFAVQIGDE